MLRIQLEVAQRRAADLRSIWRGERRWTERCRSAKSCRGHILFPENVLIGPFSRVCQSHFPLECLSLDVDAGESSVYYVIGLAGVDSVSRLIASRWCTD